MTIELDRFSRPSAVYREFLKKKLQLRHDGGFTPTFIPDQLFDFQKFLVEWAVKRGRGAVFADCGLGKSFQALAWAENVVRHTNKPVLILTPLAVAHQFVTEGAKFGIECCRSSDGKYAAKIVATNYQRLHYFNSADFAGVVCDESSILKNFDGSTKAAVTEFMRLIPYRLLCTATAAPNDFVELGTSSEALGELGFQDMVTKFFRKETAKDYLGWGRTKYLLRTHAERDFWRWVCSWARACRKPSDLGFDDGKYILPPLTINEFVVEAKQKRAGHLFDVPAQDQRELQEERRRTVGERCEKAAELVNGTGQPAVVWCHLNDEGDLLERLIPDSVQVSGSDDDDAKEERLDAFARGQIRVLVTKPKIAQFGLNLQVCAHAVYFPSDSFESWYQSIRRCWRFGQTRPVVADVIASEGQAGVRANLQRKQDKCETMFRNLIALMNEHLQIKLDDRFTKKASVPTWLCGTSSAAAVPNGSGNGKPRRARGTEKTDEAVESK